MLLPYIGDFNGIKVSHASVVEQRLPINRLSEDWLGRLPRKGPDQDVLRPLPLQSGLAQIFPMFPARFNTAGVKGIDPHGVDGAAAGSF